MKIDEEIIYFGRLSEMTTSANQSNLFSQYAPSLYQLSQLALEVKNEKMIYQLKGLMERLQELQLYITFCGHYSAGKSSLLNKLFYKNILPSSPIPTSANTVKLCDGKEEKAIIEYKNGHIIELNPLDFEEVKRLCKNGDEVVQVEIQSPYPKSLPNNLVLFDTPGIDSTDDAHQLATESMLHLADLIFYMVDYHHVQSDINMQFIKQLNEAGKKVCLIVNQIDKHVEAEILFQDFKESTIRAFSDGGAQLERVFFISIKDEASPFNEWNELNTFLMSISQDKVDWLRQSFSAIIPQLTKEWELFIEAAFSDQLTELEENVSGQSLGAVIPDLELLNKQLISLKAKISEVKTDFNRDLNKVLHNSYLMDFKTRELAKVFLESKQEGFKVGVLFSKKKTMEEQERREDELYVKIKEQMETQFEWHVKQLAQATIEKQIPEAAELQSLTQAIKCELPKSLISNVFKPAASLTGQYVLQYSRDLENEVKKIVQRETMEFLEQLLTRLSQKNQQQIVDTEKKIEGLENLKHKLVKIEEIQEQKSKLLWKWQEKLQGTVSLSEKEWDFQIEQLHSWLIENRKEELLEGTDVADSLEKQDVKEEKPSVKRESQPKKEDSYLHRIADEFKHIEALSSVAESVKTKAARLDAHTFTVTLFGAFSAGKSSFINGLLGTKLLPSSPNPMTAALTEIKAPQNGFEHQSIQVHYKTDEQLAEELRDLLSEVDPSLSIDHIWKIAKEEHFNDQHPYLKAFIEGYPKAKEKLGLKEKSTLKELPYYAAKETVSCFVERIEVFENHPLTNAGMTLVDTPGSDSLNTRHTGVAFEHIKNSDAIIYVTYYHHAFGKADREFLIQLGRVKDSFSLDKMFFVVNASDLAETEEERADVVEYVRSQLLSYGLRYPRLFPVSSVHRLANQSSDMFKWDGFDGFEASFLPFIENDLKQVTRQGAWKEVDRGIEMLKSFIHIQNKSQEEKDAIRNEFVEKKATILEKIDRNKEELYRNRLEQETKELIHYVRKRVEQRSRDFFKETFHPSRLQDGNGSIKDRLELSLKEWLELLDFDLTQELRATSLRLENYVNKLLLNYFQEITQEIQQTVVIPFSEPVETKKETPIFGGLLNHVKNVSFQPALQLYKNAKSFFEKNEKEKMLEKLGEIIDQPMSLYCHDQETECEKLYGDLLVVELEHLNSRLQAEVTEYLQGQIAALSSEEEAFVYEKALNHINELIE